MTRTLTSNRSAAIAVSILISLCLALVHPARAQQYAQPGKFDFYLFSLSWSPQFCSITQRPSAECNTHGGNFVVHGLWPEFRNGSWPSDCSRDPGPSNPATVADVMPPSLVRHEWQKHGSCSGLDANTYFDLIRKVKGSINVPSAFLNLHATQSVAPAEIKASFIASNPAFQTDDLRIGCANNALSEVKICMTRDAKPTGCGTLRDCRASRIKVLPVLP